MDSTYLHCRFQPTEEDIEMYNNFSGDKMSLPSTDQFMMKVFHISYVKLEVSSCIGCTCVVAVLCGRFFDKT